LKIDFYLPGGGHLHIKREPMEMSKFYTLAALAAGVMVLILLLSAVRG